MQNIWSYISNLGTSGGRNQSSQRTIILSNQLNFVMLITSFFLFITTLGTNLLTHDIIDLGTLRVAFLLIINFFILVIARFGFTQLSKIALIYVPTIVLMLFPTLIGWVEEESYSYYAYGLIAFSVIPQLLLQPDKEKILYWASLAYFFLLVVFIERIMIHFGHRSFAIVDRIKTFYPYYKIVQITIFLFINASIFYLRRLNFRYENELNKNNNVLDLQNKELKVQKDEIERQKDELVNKEISTWQKLVTIITHEIVNSAIPITNLAGMAGQMLEDETGAVLKPEKIGQETTEDIHHSLKVIESRTQALINFVKATKNLTRIPQPNIRLVLLKEIFDRITTLFKTKFKETGVQLEKQIIPPDLSIEADLELIEQVMINLIQNALEAMQEISDPRLSIIASINESGQIQIAISDNGVGISNEVMERIFLPFYSTKANNSGIGMSLSQQIMMLHHARLEVTSVLGKGATFSMVF